MKLKTILLIMLIMIGILPYTAAANPGLEVLVDPLSQTTISGNTIVYDVILNNTNENYDITMDNIIVIEKQTSWTYTFDDVNGMIIPIGENLTIELSVTSPFGTPNGLYNHKVDGNGHITIVIPGIPGIISESYIDLPEYDYEFFDTIIYDSTAPIPEFPTIALPVLSVIGLMLMFGRRKS